MAKKKFKTLLIFCRLMYTNNMKVDLHIHSNRSDGDLSPEEIVDKCDKSGLDLIALTDHDNVNGVMQAKRYAQTLSGGLKVLSGIELSAFDGELETHILAYGIDHTSAELQEKMQKIQNMREDRNLKMIYKLKTLGISIDYDLLKSRHEGEVIGRAHIAKEMVNLGVCSSVPDAFTRYLSPSGQAYVVTRRLTVPEAVSFAGKFGGIAVLAHPSKLKKNTAQTENFVRQLVQLGLVGIEACYFSHTNIERDFYLYLAERYGLHVFGGSDFHNESYGVQLGAYYQPAPQTCDLLLKLAEN